jgi:membrane fusion protein (multidrug efflux system)
MTTPKNKYTRTDQLITKATAWVAATVILVLGIWGSITAWRSWQYEETNDAQVEEYINPLTARVTGYIQEIRYEENQEVKAGDTLVVIEASEYRIHEAEAEAALAHARAQIRVLETSIESAGKNARVNLSQIAAAKAKRWHQEQDYARYQKLLATESATQQQFEKVKTALEVARADFETLEVTYQANLAKMEDIGSQKAVALAEIKRREAILARARLDVTYTIITAPYDGKIGKKTIQKGQLVQPGQTLAFIVDLEEGKWVIANYKETQIRRMYVGELAEIETDAFPGVTFHGRIESLSPATGSRFSLLPPDNATGNFVKIIQRIPVRIRLTDDKASIKSLRAGMNAEVTIRNKS